MSHRVGRIGSRSAHPSSPGPDGKIGRPTILTPALARRFIAALKSVYYVEYACGLLRISKPAVYSWVKRGLDSDEEPFHSFAYDLKRVRAEFIKQRLAKVMRPGKQWAAHMTILERIDPRRWGRVDRAHFLISGDPQHPLRYVVEVPTLAVSAEEWHKQYAPGGTALPMLPPAAGSSDARPHVNGRGDPDALLDAMDEHVA